MRLALAALAACSRVSTTHPYDAQPDTRPIDAARIWSMPWSGDMPTLWHELRIDTTLVSVGPEAIHERAIYSPHGFGARIDTPLPGLPVYRPLLDDLDGFPGLDVAVIIGAEGNRRIEVLRNVGLAFTPAATLPAASDEDILALAAVPTTFGSPRLVALVQTPQGRRLRVYPGQPQAAFTPASASDYSDPLLASIVPATWVGDYDRLYVSTPAAIYIIELTTTGIGATTKIADIGARSLDTYGGSPTFLLIGSGAGVFTYDRAAMYWSLYDVDEPTSTIGVVDTGLVYAQNDTLLVPPTYPATTLPFAPRIVRGFRRSDALPATPYSVLIANGASVVELVVE